MDTCKSLGSFHLQGWRITFYLLLVLAGLAGNYFAYPIFLNIDFLFGGIFALLALQSFGIWPGVLAAALIASYTYVIWNEPYALIIMSAEVAFVGYLTTRRKVNMVLADTLYWLVIGMPMGYVFYHFVLKVPDSGVWMIATKQAVNGIAAALLARLVYSSFGVILKRWQLTFGEVMANLLVLFVVGPSLLILGLSSREDFAQADRDLRDDITLHASHAKALFQLWIKGRNDALLPLATVANTLSAAQFNTRLELIRNADANFLRLGLSDKDSVILADAPKTDETGHSNVGKLLMPAHLETMRKSGQPMLSEVFMSRLDTPPQPIALLLHPVSKQGQFDGYVSAVLKFDGVLSMLSHAVQDTQTLFTLIDQQGRVIMSNRPGQPVMQPLLRNKRATLTPVGGGVQQWVPEVPANTSISDRWRQSFYVVETPVGLHDEWKLVLEDPVAPVQHLLYNKYARQLGVLFILILISVLLAEYLSRKSVATLRALGAVTHELADKISNGVQTVDWPRSAMRETADLIRNFQSVATSLQSTFGQLKLANATLEQQVAERTQQLERLLREQTAVLNNELIGIVRVIDRHIVWANAAFEQMLGYEPGQAQGTPTQQNYPNADTYQRLGEAAYPVMAAGKIYRGQIEHVRRDGRVIWVDLSGTILNAASGESLWTFSDITEHMKAESIVHAYAFHDPLTQLPNRRMLLDRMTQTMATGQRHGLYGAVLFLDLDNFKSLNDNQGHNMGDMLLVEVANRLTNCVRKVDTVARFGGDEFVLLMGELGADKPACVTQVQNIAEKIRSSLAQPYFINARDTLLASTIIEHHCTVSIGVALFLGESEPQNELLQHADQAMYQAKDAGRNQVHIYAVPALTVPFAPPQEGLHQRIKPS